MLEKTAGQYEGVDFRTEALERPGDCARVDGLEVERLPAVIIDGEQVTAGGLLHRRQLARLIEERM